MLDTPMVQEQGQGGDDGPVRMRPCRSAFTYEYKAMNPLAMKATFTHILDVTISNLAIKDLLAISPGLGKEVIEYLCTHCAPASIFNITAKSCPSSSVLIKYSTLLHKI